MATRQGLDASIVNRLGANEQALFLAVKAEFDTDDIMVWSGTGDITIASESYTGAGSLLSIGTVEDTTEIKSSGMDVAISGMDTTVLNYALTENYQNRPITIFLGYLMGGTNEVAGTLTLFKGRMTTLSVSDTPEGAGINISAENRLVDLDRPSNFRYTKESQNFLHSGDTGFNRVASLQDKEIVWGKTGWGGSTGGNDRRGGNDRVSEQER
tara:strand:- start:198 stop:833 length:636 start_codon:yes stop_codon:yes gene_type:complete